MSERRIGFQPVRPVRFGQAGSLSYSNLISTFPITPKSASRWSPG